MSAPFVPPSFGDKTSFQLKFTRARDASDVKDEVPDAKTAVGLILPLMTDPDSIVMSYGVIQKTVIKATQQCALMIEGLESSVAKTRMYGILGLCSAVFSLTCCEITRPTAKT